MLSQTIFNSFNQTRVLIIGDLMIDRYIFGSVNRISPEAPVPVVDVNQQENRLGGAANVALNVKALGGTPFLCSLSGDDVEADLFLAMLDEKGISKEGIVRDKTRPTTVKTRVIARNQQLLRYDSESKIPISTALEDELLKRIKKQIKEQKVDVILFQDYNKGLLSVRLIRELLLLSVLHDIPTVVDPKHQNFFEYRNVTLFKPNLHEIRENVPMKVKASELSSLEEASHFLRNKLKYQYAMVTLSSKGIYLDSPEKKQLIPTQARAVADVCGAGDTVVAIAAMGVAQKMDMEELTVLANLAGGIVCEDIGVVPINKKKLIAEYDKVLENLS